MNAPESALSRLALAAAARGLRTVVPGQALSLAVARSGELVVERGTAWVTFDVPARGRPGAPLGDLVLAAGARLPLACGQRLVIEPIARTGETPQPLVFGWRPPTQATGHVAPFTPLREAAPAL